MTEAIFAIISAVAGATATYFIPLIHKSLGSKRRNDLSGEWMSLSFSSEEEGWLPDRIQLDTTLISIKLKNLDKPCGYEYEGRASVFDDRYLNGEWWSTRTGATNSGPFSFAIAPQGNYLFGFYGGSERDGAYKWSIWLLGRDEGSLAEAKKRMLDAAATISHSGEMLADGG